MFTFNHVIFKSFVQSIDRDRQNLMGEGSKEERKVWFYQTTEDEEDHEQASQGGFCIDIPIAHCRHGHHQQVDAFPIG